VFSRRYRKAAAGDAKADPATLNLLRDTRLSTSSAAQLIAGIAVILNAYLAARALVRVSLAVRSTGSGSSWSDPWP